MPRTIHVAHSPDSDDAFMFYALAAGKLDTGDLRYEHELSDIESLNRRALRAELEVSAVSIHAYAHLHRTYALLASGSSMGDGYGPRLVSRSPVPADPRTTLRGLRVAIPGDLTTAALALRLGEPGVRVFGERDLAHGGAHRFAAPPVQVLRLAGQQRVAAPRGLAHHGVGAVLVDLEGLERVGDEEQFQTGSPGGSRRNGCGV